MVAFVVSQHFSFDAAKIMARLDRIRKTAAEIINAIELQEAAE